MENVRQTPPNILEISCINKALPDSSETLLVTISDIMSLQIMTRGDFQTTEIIYFFLVVMSVVMWFVMIVLFFQLISPLEIHKICLDTKLHELLSVYISFLIGNVLDGVNVRS